MKGIILAGGKGSRLYPITKGVSKQLLPVFDKPMIYYPLSVLILAGIKEILIITTPDDKSAFQTLLKNGQQWGINISFQIQNTPRGLADAFILGEEFLDGQAVCLILGDNIFYGDTLSEKLFNCVKFSEKKASVFGYHVENPKDYGVISFDKQGKANSIEEKPKNPKSNYAIVGLYFYPNSVVEIAKSIKPSERGELEISDINQVYLEKGNLNVEILGRGYAWLDTGTHESLMEASQFIQTIEKRQGLKIGCLEEVAFQKGLISKKQILEQAKAMENTSYGQYLIKRYED
ncbi:MAG: glucose-1-phosphate thymidylyltransferase [Candidatus Endolissoclinum sp. TMED37]|nr:MAG: glucose-1-phosphate thymidylyltransferase [Candidatus Endolissoclinum sp. TMED37]